VEVIQLFRQHAGKDVMICIDAGNGSDLVGAQHFLKKVGDPDLIFVEELFPETVEECLALMHFISEHCGQRC
jgi:L-alanine-DL-glutamate epimerase-like enolase superfamily enzyme